MDRGKHSPATTWAICKGCGHYGVMTGAGRPVCSRCGSRDYGLTINDPAKPDRKTMEDTGPHGARLVLPDDPPIDVEATLKAGRYP